MFCPKCGSQNADGTKFCRGCGADISQVLAVVDRKGPATRTLAEEHIDLYSRGIRGLLLGIGFLFVSGVVFSIPPTGGFFWLFPLMFAILCISTGISRFVQARGIKALTERDETVALPPAQTEYIKPSHSIYETDDLAPISVTEDTTRNLR